MNRSIGVPLPPRTRDRKDCSLSIRPFSQLAEDLKWGITYISEGQEGDDQPISSLSQIIYQFFRSWLCDLTIRLYIQVIPIISSSFSCILKKAVPAAALWQEVHPLNKQVEGVLGIRISAGLKHFVPAPRPQFPLGASWMPLHTFSWRHWGNSSM